MQIFCTKNHNVIVDYSGTWHNAVAVTCSVIVMLVGTRYKRRGVDEEGYTANYVETEQVSFLHLFLCSYSLLVIRK